MAAVLPGDPYLKVHAVAHPFMLRAPLQSKPPPSMAAGHRSCL